MLNIMFGQTEYVDLVDNSVDVAKLTREIYGNDEKENLRRIIKVYKKYLRYNATNKVFKEIILNKKIKTIPLFIDLAYISFIKHFDKSAPVFKLPTNVYRLNINTSSIKPCIATNTLKRIFGELINSRFIHTLYTMPYELTHGLDNDTINSEIEKIDLTEKFKLIIQLLIKLIYKSNDSLAD